MPGRGRPFVSGDPRQRPGSGRPKAKEQNAWLRGWFESEEGRAHCLARMKADDAVLRDMYRHAYGNPPDIVTMTGADNGPLKIIVAHANH